MPPEDFRGNLDAMLSQTREAGVPTLILLPPQPGPLVARRPSLPRYQSALRDAAERHGVASIALQPIFEPFLPSELFGDDYRLRPLGHRLVGESIYVQVRDAGLAGRAS